MKEMPYHPWVILSPEEYLNPTRTVDGHGIDSDWADKITLETHLTDAECAAEYWRARAAMCSTTPVFTSGAELQKFIQAWERFATHPHARERDYQ